MTSQRSALTPLACAFALLIVLASCSSTKPSATPTSSPTGSATAAPAKLGNLKEGSASFTVSGSASGSATLPLNADDSQLHPPPGGFAIFWKKGNDLLTLGGVTFNGTRRTSKSVVVGFVWLDGKTPVSATSSAGECSITMTSTARSVSGTFTCAGLKQGSKTYGLKGRFTATA